MLEVVHPFNRFARGVEYLAVLENLKTSNIFTPVSGYFFNAQMLAIIATEDSSHFLADMATRGVLTYTEVNTTVSMQDSTRVTVIDYLRIESVDMQIFSRETQDYIDENRAPMAGPLVEIRNDQNRDPTAGPQAVSPNHQNRAPMAGPLQPSRINPNRG